MVKAPPGTKRPFSGNDLRRILAAGTRAVERNAEAINALNVFPVPDGDTGTNMLLTLRAVQEALDREPGGDAGAVLVVIARAALLGARGNAGVILSQFLRGLAHALEGKEQVEPADLARAWQVATAEAYKAVSRPVEGTMLTVMREAGLAAQRAATSRRGKPSALGVLEAALEGARTAVARTPELLPVLREAGVVDAGGQGFALVLEGAVRALRGESLEEVCMETVAPTGRVSMAFLKAIEDQTYGYCTQFTIQGCGLDPEAIRQHLSGRAESAVVIGDQAMVRVHVHVADPGPVMSYGVSLGTLAGVRVENMQEQNHEFVAARKSEQALASLGVVSVVWGDGLAKVMRNLGAAVVPGGQTMNPSCQELLEAVEKAPAATVILLPNNPNIIPTAQQAVPLACKPLHVVSTRSIPQGIAALLALSPDQDVEAAIAAMERAAASVRSGEVVTAIRDARLDGQAIRRGQVMGLLDGDLSMVGDSPPDVVEELVARAQPEEGQVLTLYWGGDVDQPMAESLAASLRRRWDHVDVELVYGGQPYYHYVFSLE
ncbi:MAG: DAK2 domain-containing protein [Chloroflexi bacterium]|nr:DAK2 domain-containing protein [Chloroflexota bacterium]